MITWNIYQVINYSTAEIKNYEPGDQVAEIVSAEARAAEAARLQQCRERLTNIKPVRAAIAGDGGESLARELFPPPELIG